MRKNETVTENSYFTKDFSIFLNELNVLNETSYPGNLGVIELFKFYQKASPKQKSLMQEALAKKDFRIVFDLIKKITGVSLHETLRNSTERE